MIDHNCPGEAEPLQSYTRRSDVYAAVREHATASRNGLRVLELDC